MSLNVKKEKTALRAYGRHLIRTVRRQPLQPLFLVIILTLACLMQIVGLSVSDAIELENERKNESSCGIADVRIEVGADADARFITAKAAQTFLPDTASVTGVISISYVREQDVLYGYAVDFDTVNDVFPLWFTESNTVPSALRGNALFITQDYADAYALAVGDTVTLQLFNSDVVYTVYGISPYPFLGDGSVLCDVSSVVAQLTQKSDFVSLFAQGTEVFSRLYIAGIEPDSSTLEALSALYPDAVVSAVQKNNFLDGFNFFGIISAVMVLMTEVAALVVSATGCYCMAKEREEYTFLFSLVGFSRCRAYFYRVLEMLAYAVVALLIGLILSIPCGRAVYAYVNLKYVTYAIMPYPVLTAVGASLILCFLSPLLAEIARTAGHKKQISGAKWIAAVCSGILLLCVVAVILLPVRLRFGVTVVGVACGVLAAALGISPMLAHAAEKAPRHTDRKNVPAVLARKNCRRVGELANSCRLVAVLLPVIMTAGFLCFAVYASIVLEPKMFDASYAVVGGNTTVPAVLEDTEEVGKTFLLRTAVLKLENGKSANVWGVSDIDVFGNELKALTLPDVGEAFGSRFTMESRDMPVGTTYELDLGKSTVAMTMIDSKKITSPYLITNAETLTGVNATYLVRPADGVSDIELYNALCEALADSMVTIVPTSSLVSHYLEIFVVYFYFCRMMLLLLIAFGLFGVCNNLAENLRSRRTELGMFVLCGMTKKEIRRMMAQEYRHVARLSVGLGLLLAAVFIVLVNYGIRGYSTDCFVQLGVYFKYYVFA